MDESVQSPFDVDAEKVIKIDRRDLRPVNDPNCQHNHYEDEEDADSNENWVVVKCRACPTGFLKMRA